MSDAEPLLYTPEQAAARLGDGLKASWLRRAAARGAIPRTYVGRFLRFSEQNLTDLVAQCNQPVVGRAASSRSTRSSR